MPFRFYPHPNVNTCTFQAGQLLDNMHIHTKEIELTPLKQCMLQILIIFIWCEHTDLARTTAVDVSVLYAFYVRYLFIYLFNFATRAGSPQQREPITVGPYYLPTLSIFPVGGNRSNRRKPTTFSRALTILFSNEDWVRVHIKMNLTGDRTRNLRGERRVV